MLSPKLQMLQRTVKRLMRRGAAGALDRVLIKTHAADLAYLLSGFPVGEQVKLLERCHDDEKRSAVLAATEAEVAAGVLAAMPRDGAVRVLNGLEPDDASDVFEAMPSEVAEDLLERMRGAARREVEELSRYESATAGGIMSPRFFALNRDTTVSEAIETLQRDDTELEMVFYVYVVNEVGQLLGVCSLRQLVTTKRGTKLIDIMTSDIISVTPEVDQEDVAKLASRYGLLAIPVVEPGNKLLGIVTVDDVIDVLREEATEDIMRMAGAGDPFVQQHVLRSALSRVPSLLATGVGGAASALLVAAYLGAFPLVFFIPLLLGLAGVAGIQAATVIAQNISQERGRGPLFLQLLRQVAIGALLALVAGAVVGASVWLWAGGSHAERLVVALKLGGAIAAAMCAATVLGCVLPLAFNRLRLDPTVTAGPLGAIAADLLGLAVYLAIGSRAF